VPLSAVLRLLVRRHGLPLVYGCRRWPGMA